MVQDGGSASLSLSLAGAVGSLWVGGIYGPELRPAYLVVPTIYNFPERSRGAVSAGGDLELGGGWKLRASWEHRWLGNDEVSSSAQVTGHLMTLGVLGTF